MEQKHKTEDSNELQVRSGQSRALTRAASKKSYSIAPYTPAINTTRIKSASVKAPISIIPKEAKGRKKGASFESQEPTSPKVSCIGQVKLKKKQARKARVSINKGGSEKLFSARPGKNKVGSEKPFSLPAKETRGELVKISKLRRLFSANKLTDQPREEVKEEQGNNYSSLGQMKRFKSGRESAALANIYAEELSKKDTGI